MNKREQQFTTKFQKWLKHNHTHQSMAWEVKVGEGSAPIYLNTDTTKNELRNLWLAKHKQVIYKLSDYAATGTPFDGFLLAGCAARLICHWHRPRNKTFYLIDADDILADMVAGAKSITEERAERIGWKEALA